MTEPIRYDLVIVGAGSGNSMIVPEMDDWKIAIVERGLFGGTCLNVGCIPTKMFVHPADLAHEASHSERFGISTRFLHADWPAMRDRIFGRIDPIAAGGQRYRESLEHVDVHAGTGAFVGVREMAVGDVHFTADRFVLANGARSRIPIVPGLDSVPFHTSDTIMRLDRLPEHLIILGGGFIANEMAHIFHGLGSKVTIVNRSTHLMTAEDREISERYTNAVADRYDLVLGATVHAVSACADDGTIGLDVESSGQRRTIVGDTLLVATGRVPNGDTLNPSAAGVVLGAMGEVVVDEYGRTSAEGIWAIGDVNGRHQLKHMANGEARVVTHNLLHPNDLRRFEDRPAPHAVFASPQLASVGIDSATAHALGHRAVTVTHDYAGSAWGWALEDTTSFAKLIGDRDTGRLLGAHVMGPQASTLASLLVQGMYLGNTVEEMARNVVYIHPAPSEVIEQALLKLVDALRG
jgi:mycothione reductase